MGILNVTPDSFSDGGRFFDANSAIDHAKRMISEGAHILDIGGESTRPGAASVTVEDEIARVIPVIEVLRQQSEVAISIDTSKPEVARAALTAGADIINDVTGFRDAAMLELCQNSACGMVAMHMQGTPQTMQQSPEYDDVTKEVRLFFEDKYREVAALSIEPCRVVFDPGIGFGKTIAHNLALLKGLAELSVQGRPLLMGLSRKSFIEALTGEKGLDARAWPTVALSAYARRSGAVIHRVHDVLGTIQALQMIEAIEGTN